MADIVKDPARLAELEAYGLMDTPPEAHFDAIVAQAAAVAQAPISMITLVDDRRQWFKARVGLTGTGDPIDQSICADALRAGETHVVPDASADDRYRDFAQVKGGLGIRFYAGVPLETPGGARLGTLCVIDIAARDGLDDAQRAALEALARRTVAAFELRREMRRRGEVHALDNAGTGNDDMLWLDQASGLLAQASAALDQVGASVALAQLENVIAIVDTQRHALVPAD